MKLIHLYALSSKDLIRRFAQRIFSSFSFVSRLHRSLSQPIHFPYKLKLYYLNCIYFIQFNYSIHMASNQPAPLETFKQAQQVPITYDKRPLTDLFCIVVGVTFSVIMIILGIVLFNNEHYIKSNFPTDSDGKLCGVDIPGYNYVYFANPPQIARRVCVTKCPSPEDLKLDCKITEDVGCKYNNRTNFEVKKYDNQAYDGGQVGYFCFPTDQDLKSQLLDNANLKHRILMINSVNIIVAAMLFSLGLSIFYAIAVHFFSKQINKYIPYAALLIIFALVICLFAYYSQAPAKSLIAIILLIAFIVIAVGLYRNRHSTQIYGIFLHQGSNVVGKAKFTTFLYIPLFMAFLTGFILLIVMEFRSFWAGTSLKFEKQVSIFYEFNSTGPAILCVFLLLQSLWGLSFLKEAFNFIISGFTVSNYHSFQEQGQSQCLTPLKILVFKHFGSVIGGSFMTAFFTVGDYIFDLFKPSVEHANDSSYKKCYSTIARPFKKLFDLVRSDAMGYIYTTGNPYCNSARYCEYLSNNSAAFEDNQSSSRVYRLSAHMFIGGIVSLICLYLKGAIVPTAVLIIFFSSFFISTFFISLHADAAQALSISFILDQQCQRRQQNQEKGLYEETYSKIKNFKSLNLYNQIKDHLKQHPHRRQRALQN